MATGIHRVLAEHSVRLRSFYTFKTKEKDRTILNSETQRT